jgi:hypothetical protein
MLAIARFLLPGAPERLASFSHAALAVGALVKIDLVVAL